MTPLPEIRTNEFAGGASQPGRPASSGPESDTSTVDPYELAHETMEIQVAQPDADPQATEPVRVSGLGMWINDGDHVKWIVRNLSFAARAGQVIGLAGPSGSGKTTVLMCLAGVTRHAEGDVSVAGANRRPGQLAKPAELRRVGVVFQDYHLVQSLDALDNVALPLRLDGVSWRKARPAAAKMIASFGLARAMYRYPAQMSGGEQQRVAIARAMVRQPTVLLADEPTAHLDAASTAVVSSSLETLAGTGTCVVVSSHDPRLLSGFEHVIDLGAIRS